MFVSYVGRKGINNTVRVLPKTRFCYGDAFYILHINGSNNRNMVKNNYRKIQKVTGFNELHLVLQSWSV